MIIIMKPDASLKQVTCVLKEVRKLGLKTYMSKGEKRSVIGLIGIKDAEQARKFEFLSGVDKVNAISRPFKLASREFNPDKSTFNLNGVCFGGKEVVIIAGPCAVESRQQILETASAIKSAGAKLLRGGAFKPRTSPYSFQGLKEEGLELLQEAKEKTGLLIVTEVIAPEHVKLVAEVADVFQIGTRNMQNYALLEAVGLADKPVLLKRGMMANVEEFLMAAEYILANGNPYVLLCERGIRTFEKFTRNTLDLAAIPLISQLSHLPICVDPSHGTGMGSLVNPVSKAAVAAGADALIIEVHPSPEKALSDGFQSLSLREFEDLMRDLKPVANAVGRTV